MRFAALLLCLIATPAFAQDIAPTNAKSPEDERKTFKLPDGFEAQLVASEPRIEKPMQIAWDAKGRLWVTTSRHYPFAAETGKATDKLFVLSDFAANGLAGKIEAFDDKLNIPIGVLPLPDGKSVIVSSVGEILKLTDSDGDGKADKRETLFTGFGTRDTHGMYNSFTLMPDGWVYACHGYLNQSKVKGKDGHEVEMHSGNTFRFRPDGSRIEVFTRGQVNPFGMTVDPWGNLYTADCHSKPITQLIRGAHYDSFGKPHDGLGYAPHVTRHDHGSTALCGLAWYQANHYPAEYDGCMFLGNVVTNRINADKIEWKGSTPVAKEMPDFLVSSDPWFRPTDIKLGPDGALYVADFYNKIIGHYEVDLKHPQRDKDHGRLWRIVYTKTHIRFDQGSIPKSEIIDRTDTERTRTEAERTQLIDRLKGSPRAVRIAVDAMTAKPYRAYVSPLLRLLTTIPADDTHLRHAAKIALRNSLATDGSTFLQPDVFYARENPAANAVMVGVCPGLPTAASAEHLARAFLFTDLGGYDRGVVAEFIGRHGGTYEQYFVAQYVRGPVPMADKSLAVTGYLLGLRAAGRPLTIPEPFIECVVSGVDSSDPKVCAAALLALKDLPNPTRASFEIAAGKLQKANTPAEVKLAACEAVFALNAKDAAERLTPLCFDAAEQIAVREKAATLASATREMNNLIKLKDAIKAAPYRLAVVLAAGLAADRFGSDLLFAAVKAGDAPARVLQERTVQTGFKNAKVAGWETTVAELTKGIPAADARINALIRERALTFGRGGHDAAKGKDVYAKHCAACHLLENQGGKIGPNLDGIGIRGADRLLEDILDPNRHLDAAFRATTLNLADGRTVTGLVLREEGAVIVMADNDGKELHYNKADVEKRTLSNVSPMPADWGEKLPSKDLHDLLAFVLTKKAK